MLRYDLIVTLRYENTTTNCQHPKKPNSRTSRTELPTKTVDNCKAVAAPFSLITLTSAVAALSPHPASRVP